MVFSSLPFLLLLLPVTLSLYYFVPRRLKNPLLLAASLAFYAYGGAWHTWILCGVILLSWGFALLLAREKRPGIKRALLWTFLALVLGTLGYFKYSGFLARILGLAGPDIALPIGISFFTFQAISYVADVYRGEPALHNPLDVGLYLSFFPQLIAGPIVRYHDIAGQLRRRKSTLQGVGAGLIRFSRGLCKKVLVANSLAVAADYAFAPSAISGHPALILWLGALCYALQLYFDFSGYSDMAIGLGRVFGFRFRENFRHPYLARTGSDFWRRWHISLSAWFREYVYIPLGGNRRGAMRTARNLLVVWLLTGLWHGADWSFAVWGLSWGALLILEKWVFRPDERSAVFRGVYRAFLMLFVLLSWVLFRAGDLAAAGHYLSGLLPGPGRGIPAGTLSGYLWFFRDTLMYLAVGLLLALRVPHALLSRLPGRVRRTIYPLRLCLLLGLTALSFAFLAHGGYNPFLYFSF